MRLALRKEGKTKFYVPKTAAAKAPKGPGTKASGFYNPAMEFCRDVTVVVVKALAKEGSGPSFKRGVFALDALAGTGVRGVRLANEVGKGVEVTINDVNPEANRLIEKNIEYNKLKNATASKRNANALMHDGSFNYIDIDPYGTPVTFLDTAIQCAGRGVLGITATDTAALCGSKPKASLRRYGAKTARTPFMHESGLRILLGACAKISAAHDKGIKPMLSHATDHYMRIYIQLVKGARKAEKCLEALGHAVLWPDGERGVVLGHPGNMPEGSVVTGPLWAGNLHDPGFLEKLRIPTWMENSVKIDKQVMLWAGEAVAPPLFYDADEIAKRLKIGPPPMKRAMSGLEDAGFVAVPTQFSPKGIKTDAGFKEIASVFLKITDND